MTTRRVSGVAKPAAPRSGEIPQFERFLAELSARFINLPAARIDQAIIDALRRFVEILGVDRSQLIRFSADGEEIVVTHSWAVEGVPAVARKSITETFPWVLRRVRADVPVVVARLDNLPAEAAVDKATWRRIGVKSNLTMPMKVAGKVEGVIAFGCLRRARNWPEYLVERVRVLATIFGNALAHKRAQEELDASIDFERTVSETLAALLTA
ncbi:MAG: GAF domain-containing protein, partial [Burkholderiales bacterium]